MLDIKFIRENKDLITEAARKKHVLFDVKKLIEIDDKRRNLLQLIEGMRAEQNTYNEKIAAATNGESEREHHIMMMRDLKSRLVTLESELKEIMKEWQTLMLQVPNVPDMSVPEGESDENNQEIRKVGEPKTFQFSPKDHITLMKDLDIADFERGAKVSGFRGYFLKNDGAMLSMAIINYVFNKIVSKGFCPFVAPSLIRRESLIGTGYLPQGEEDLYKTQDGEYLAGTAEAGMMGYFMDEILEMKDLPKKFVAISPCFRREAGSHGKDTNGIVRVHEFMKIEQVVLCEASHESSVKFHEELLTNAEEILSDLKIPYHVVINCGADLGLGQVKKYDIEAWVPSENKYRETHSASYFHDFQTRRLNIRYRDTEGKMRFVHSLNNTAVATPRILVPIIENYQQEDGSVLVPEVLQPYMGGKTIISK